MLAATSGPLLLFNAKAVAVGVLLCAKSTRPVGVGQRLAAGLSKMTGISRLVKLWYSSYGG